MIRLNEAQYRKVKKLTRRLCANNDGGCCLLLDDGDPCVCVQAISFSLLCRYFREAVLPADRELCADIMRQHDTRKKCELCGKPFHARSNRAKYCDACAVLAARRMACERKRRERERNAKTKLQVTVEGLKRPCSKPLSSRTFGVRGINLPNSRKTALKA